jgi:hypothetical protein
MNYLKSKITRGEPVFRFDLINYLIEKCGYKRYLEIGVEDGDCVGSVKCEVIHGVDPASRNATFQVESDEFFNLIRDSVKYDLVFVDGLHTADQAKRDIDNALRHLNDGGCVVVHDCSPPSEWHQRSHEEAKLNGCRQWNGDVWKAVVALRSGSAELEISVVDTDWGCGIIRRGRQEVLDLGGRGMEALTYRELAENRAEWLNLISVADFIEKY